MNLMQIAINNFKRRKKKALLALAAITLGAAALVTVYSLVRSMEAEINRQLTDIGSNLVITADSGSLSFSYGGITVPELHFDAEVLREEDLQALELLPDRQAIVAISPKLIGIAPVNGVDLALAGGSLEAEYAVKPWLHLHVEQEEGAEHEAEISAGMRRPDEVAPDLSDREVVVGKIAAERLGIEEEQVIDISGEEFLVVGILHPNGGSEDNQVFMNYNPAQEILGKSGNLTIIELAVDFSQVDELVMLGQLEQGFPHARIISVRQAVMGRNELVGTIARYGYVAALLIFFSGIFLVGLNMYSAVRERTREIGIFRAIGFRSSHIFRIICTEGVFLSAIGGLLGYHTGLLVAYRMWPLFSGGEITLTWDPLLMAAVTAITIITGTLAAALPARYAAKIDPAEALRFF